MSKIGQKSIPNEISLCLLQGARIERHISTWDKQFSEIEMNLDIGDWGFMHALCKAQ